MFLSKTQGDSGVGVGGVWCRSRSPPTPTPFRDSLGYFIARRIILPGRLPVVEPST